MTETAAASSVVNSPTASNTPGRPGTRTSCTLRIRTSGGELMGDVCVCVFGEGYADKCNVWRHMQYMCCVTADTHVLKPVEI